MAANVDNLSDEEQHADLFQEPEGYFAPEKQPTTTQYTCQSGTVIGLRLVGHSPLWGHLLWNAGKIVAEYLQDNVTKLVEGKSVLELGAGAGLPSLVCAVSGAAKVIVTDYPEPALISNLQYNIDHCDALHDKSIVVAEGYLWGQSVVPLKSHLPAGNSGFDLIILADILFNHSEHSKLVQTVKEALKPDGQARGLVFFTPYRPWLLEQDLVFFEIAKKEGLEVNKLFERVMDKVMFEEDPGDELLRRTVFAYEVRVGRV